MTRTRYRILDPNYPHFLTAVVRRRVPLLTHPAIADIICKSFSYLAGEGAWSLHAYVIMPDHLHWIARGPDLASTCRRFKSFTARQTLDLLQSAAELSRSSRYLSLLRTDAHGQDFQFWRRGNHPKIQYSDQVLRQKIAYIHHNPVRTGLAASELEWPYSSARQYYGTAGRVPVEIPLLE